MALNTVDNWAEYVVLILLIIGFILALLSGSAVISYIIIFLCGGAFGRLWYKLKLSMKVPWFVVMFGFLVGFLIGSYLLDQTISPSYGNKMVIIILYILGITLAYYIHEKKLLRSLEY